MERKLLFRVGMPLSVAAVGVYATHVCINPAKPEAELPPGAAIIALSSAGVSVGPPIIVNAITDVEYQVFPPINDLSGATRLKSS